jgi:hypothetical protein
MKKNIRPFIVAAGFSLRFTTSDDCIYIYHKLRNLKDAATRQNVPFVTSGHKLLNLGYNSLIYESLINFSQNL